MITVQQYFNDPQTGEQKPHPPEYVECATDLLTRVNALLQYLGWQYPVDVDTGTSISGVKGGHGGGGFRLINEAGAPDSKHKHACAVDVFDPGDKLDDVINDKLLEDFGLYREHPNYTKGWSHLQSIAPHSGKRTFIP